MTSLIKIHRKGQMTLPSRLRSAIGLSEGDLVEATVLRGKIVITPKVLIDRSGFPNADDEYTPTQRRIIDAQLAKADADIKAGRVSRTFETAGEFIADLHKANAKLSAKKTKRSVR